MFNTESNPILSKIDKVASNVNTSNTLTVDGVNTKFAAMLVMMMITAFWTWNKYSDAAIAAATNGDMPGSFVAFIFGGLIVGFIAVLVSSFKPHLSGFLAPVYAFAEGFTIGGLSLVTEVMYPGVVMQAILATIGVALGTIVLYKFNLVKVTDKFMSIVFMATAGIAVMYLVSIVFSLFGMPATFLHDGSPLSIGISLVVIFFAAMNLFVDYELINRARGVAAKEYEWLYAMGVMVTIVWLYIEFLRLFSNLRK